MRKNILPLIACFLAGMNLQAQINAEFSVNTNEGCEPLVVEFTDESTSDGTIVSWDWDFDDGSTDDVPNPIHTFIGPTADYNVCLTVTDDLAQMDTYCATITVFENPVADAGPDMILDCIVTSVLLYGEESSTGPEFIYEWSDTTGFIGNSLNIEVDQPRTYTLIVTNTETGCIASDDVSVLEDISPPFADISASASCNFPVILDTGNSVIGPNISYEWLDPALNLISTDMQVVVSETGIYTLVVTNSENGCTNSAQYEVTEPTPLDVTLEITEEILCQGVCSGSILSTVSGGCEPYTYLWSNGHVTPEIDTMICTGGVYALTVTDCFGCTEVVDIVMPEPPQAIDLEYEVTCATSANDGAIDLSVSGGTPPYLYFWSTNATIQDLNNLSPGDYSVTVVDANGCTAVEIIPLSNLIVDMSDHTIVCEGDDLQLFVDAPDAVSIEWFPDDNLSCTDCPDPVFTANASGAITYMVQVEDADGCIDQDIVIITVQSYIDFGLLQFSNSPVFEGETLELYCNVFNTQTADWSGPDNFSADICNPEIPNVTADHEGEYFVNLIDEYGCEASASVDVDILTVIDSISNNTVICEGSSAQLWVVAPDAVSVEWSPAATLDDPFSFTPIATPTEPTLYTVVVEDGSANTDIHTVFVDFDNVPVINIPDPLALCIGDTLEICPDSGVQLTYHWVGPGMNFTAPCFDINGVIPALAGFYTLTYTTNLGCSGQTAFLIDVNDFEIESITEDVVICSEGSATLEVDAPGNVTYQWFPATSLDCANCQTVTATPEHTTTYTAIVTDVATGCTDEAFVVVVVDEDCVWPGDTDTIHVVDNFDLLNIGLAYDSEGPIRENATLLWEGQFAENWFLTHPGIYVDFKHIDCNGDGIINADDTLAIVQNWGETHNFTGGDPPSGFISDPPFYIETDTLIEGESVSLAVIFGDMEIPANDVYGLAFTLEYDSTVVVPGSATMSFNNSWIGTKGQNMITIQKSFVSPGVVNVAMTRIDGEEMDGFGEIGQLNITIEDDILFRNGNEDSRNNGPEAAFKVSNIKIINNQGVEIPVSPMETFAVVDGTISVKNLSWKNSINIQPNPAKDAFFITSENIVIENISLYAITGEHLLSKEPAGSETRVDTQSLLPGIYLLKIRTQAGTMVEKVVVLK